MKTSAYLLDTAKEHIEGKISIDEAQKRIQSYYEQRTDCTEIENDTKEADIVSTRDYDFAMEKQFSYEGTSLFLYFSRNVVIASSFPFLPIFKASISSFVKVSLVT